MAFPCTFVQTNATLFSRTRTSIKCGEGKTILYRERTLQKEPLCQQHQTYAAWDPGPQFWPSLYPKTLWIQDWLLLQSLLRRFEGEKKDKWKNLVTIFYNVWNTWSFWCKKQRFIGMGTNTEISCKKRWSANELKI